MKTIEQLRADLARVGATLDEGNGYALNCDAPSGYVWAASGTTCICISCATNSQTFFAAAINADGLPRLRMGLRKVVGVEEIVEIRHLLDDDSWGAGEAAPMVIGWPN